MSKRLWSVFLASGLVASAFAAAPAKAQTPPEVPETVQIEDPAGDANYLNEGTAPGAGHNHSTPADTSTLADILRVWFANDADNVFVHIQTEAPPPGAGAVHFSTYTNPGEGPQGSSALGCLRFRVVIPGTAPGGGTYQGEQTVKIHDRCNTGGSFVDAPDGEARVEPGPDGTGIIVVTAPRSASPFFADGGVLTQPSVISSSPVFGSSQIGIITTSTDDTEIGTDYALVSGDGEVAPPGKNDPPGKKKGCDNGKGKKTGCAKSKKSGKAKGKGKKGKKGAPAACTPFTPGELGAEAETVTVTDAATEEKPLEVKLAAGAGLPEVDVTHIFHNVQIDTASAESGLYARLEFGYGRDYDLYLRYADGSQAARAAGFNPAPFVGVPGVFSFNDTENGGHTEEEAEALDGIRSADCQGYTFDVATYFGEGGELTLKLWLGAPSDYAVPPPGGGR